MRPDVWEPARKEPDPGSLRVAWELQTPPPARPLDQAELGRLPCLDGIGEDDSLVAAIRADLAGAASVLALMRQYLHEIGATSDNDSLPLRKLRKLFAVGRVPAPAPLGHHYGVTLGLRTGDLPASLSECGNVLGSLWGTAIGPSCPWVGKSFTPLRAAQRPLVGDSVASEVNLYRGINHFHRMTHQPINLAGNRLLDLLWHLEDATQSEQRRYGYEKNGGHFIARRAMSVYGGTPREVFQINYRYPALHNPWPLGYLIDELVELGRGLYLGQLLFATAHLDQPYDPLAPDATYHYQHFGYFLLVGEPWNAEARRLFPHLEMPAIAAVAPPGPITGPSRLVVSKLTTLTLAPQAERGMVNAGLLDAVRDDLAQTGSVLQLLQGYSNELIRSMDGRSPIFDKLQALFQAGVTPEQMDGFHAGALVSWLSPGALGAFGKNSLNLGWRIVRSFSPWTGKCFDPIDAIRLCELTDGVERDATQARLCANTVSFRTPREKLTRFLMQQMDLWIEDASAEEERCYGYQAKTFFFIGHPAASVAAQNDGKRVYQFNYRWPKLRNPPPDCWCIDELVQIAEGLYLGQVYYASDADSPWEPAIDPSRYGYRLYEYFVLMDPEWQAHRLSIGFDLADV